MSAGRFSRYPIYKNSHIEGMEDIPTHWAIKRLKLVTEHVHRSRLPSSIAPETEVSFVPMEAVGENGGLDVSQTRSFADVESGYTFFRNGDVLIAKITPCFENGKGTLARGLTNGIGLGTTELYVLRPTPELDDEYLFYITQSHAFRQLGAAEMYGAGGQKRVPDSFVSDFRSPIPPLPEQRAIARLLDSETSKIDELVTKNERVIKLLQEKRALVITRAVTKGLDTNSPMRHSGVEWLGDIPAHWERVPMWSVSTAVSGGTPAREQRAYWDGNVPWVSPKDMKKRVIDSSEETVTEKALAETGIKLVDPPAVLIVVRGMILVHTFPVAITSVPVTINQDMKALRFRPGINPLFMTWLLEGIGRALLPVVVEEAAHGTRAIRMDQWRMVTIALPPEAEQRAIVTYLDRETQKIDLLVFKIRQAVNKLSEFRTSLIAATVTGRIDVREEVA